MSISDSSTDTALTLLASASCPHLIAANASTNPTFTVLGSDVHDQQGVAGSNDLHLDVSLEPGTATAQGFSGGAAGSVVSTITAIGFAVDAFTTTAMSFAQVGRSCPDR